MESLQKSGWDTIDEPYGFVKMYLPSGEIKDGIIYVKNRIMELNITLREYQERTEMSSPRFTPASSVQKISQPPVVPFAAVSPMMSV